MRYMPLRYHLLRPGDVVCLERKYVVCLETAGNKVLSDLNGSVLRLTPSGYLYRGATMVDLDESAVSFPRPGLSPLVWDRGDDGGYDLKPEVRDSIMARLKSYPGFDLVTGAESIHIVGSIGTNQYDDDSDIDVHVVPKHEVLPVNMTEEQWVNDVKKFNKVGTPFIGDHPIELYLQMNRSQDFLSDALYDFNEGVWKIGPLEQPLDYSPFEAYEVAFDSIKDMVRDTDITIGDLKRDVIDYQAVRDAMFELPHEYHDKLKAVLQDKLVDIETEIAELLADKKEWVDMRRNSSKPITKQQALQDVELVRTWKDANATFKFLVRYGYVKLITELERMVADKALDNSEVDAILPLVGGVA